MKITEVMRGSEVTIEIKIQETPVLFKTKVLLGTAAGLLVEPIMVGDGELIWKRPGMVSVHNLRDEKSYVFYAEAILPTETQYGRVHIIQCGNDGETTEQRMAPRIEVIHMGSCKIRNTEYKALIYDISMGGIAVVLDGNVGCKIGDEVHIRFMLGEFKHVYAIEGVVVRFFDVKGRVAIGCKVAHMPLDMMGMILDKTEHHVARLTDEIPEEEEEEK